MRRRYCFFVKQKTAYEMRISDWSSDVCSSDLLVTDVIERTHCRLTAGTGALDPHFQRLHPVTEGHATRLFRCHLGRKRRRLARTAEARTTGCRPGQRVALAVGEVAASLIDRRLLVGNAVGRTALYLFLVFSSCAL